MAEQTLKAMQKTDYQGFDTVFVAPDTQLAEISLFRDQSKPKHLNNLKLPVTKDNAFMLQYGLIENGLVVKPVGVTDPTSPTSAATIQTLLAWQRDFENTSHFIYKIQNIEFPAIPLASMLPYRIVRRGGQLQIVEKPNLQNHVFRDEIDLQEGDVEFLFRPANGFQTCGDPYALALPSQIAPGGAANTLGYSLQIFLRGTIKRPMLQY